MSIEIQNKVGFAIGTGRCGTKFMCRVLGLEPHVSSVHERNPLNEAFHRYCKWYGLPVDSAGFLNTKLLEVQQDLADHQFSFEASGYLSLSVKELYERFGAKFILLVRSPERVVNSYLRKGWYQAPIERKDPNLAPTFQVNCAYFHYFLGRIIPSGDRFLEWQAMSRVGKLAWYWNALNSEVIKQFQDIPASHYRIEKVEQMTHNRYLEIADFLGFQPQLPRAYYDELVRRPPNAKQQVPTTSAWTATEIEEFETSVRPMADYLKYEYRVDQLQQHKSQANESSKLGWLERQYLKLKLKNAAKKDGKLPKSRIQ
ncbi:hypothetical protein IQ241_15780 [Romeria aff. gracilis LEGE 07310]|uniref:Sulfotransferase n=1 Tax=Vasconcelosia minhoensis LEGE 07310 TaxID=915328 RepID=A0A8J7A7Z2_9CYAN|nr:hypothetical protein [Romeria gracilis]MBE9078737.1 hypothetical protein [Romeria aff. gracilis LEGE 07310]